MKTMVKKLWMFLAAACLCWGGLQAQEAKGGVDFVEGKTFAEALAMAKESGKMLFVDCYTSWCGPCRMMATKVFPQKVVGDYFNEKFVSIKIDMEKGEGPELHKRFTVKAYPTFLFLDADGKEVNRIVGGDPDAAKFLEKVEQGVGEKSMAAMTNRYEGGERDTTFLVDYLDVLAMAYNTQKSGEVAKELLEGRGADMLTNARLYKAFLQYNPSPLSEAFTYVLDHKAEFDARYDKEELDRMMAQEWMGYPMQLISKDANGKATFDQKAMDDYVKVMKKRDVKNWKEIVLMADINVDEAMGDWQKYAKDCSRYIKDYEAGDMLIYNWVLRIQKNCKDDAEVKATAIGWMKDRLAAIEKEKANEPPLKEGEIRAMPMMDFSKYYEKLIADLEK